MRGSIFGSFSLRSNRAGHTALLPSASLGVLIVFSAAAVRAQVFTVEPEHIGGQYLEFHPTNVQFSTDPMTERTRRDLLRFLTAEQGFAARPLPIGNLTLHANGEMQPGGSEYVNELHSKGISVKAASRVTITDVKIHEDRIVFDLNGGPEHKHKFLRHVSIGADPNYTAPVVRDDGQIPTGSRITLTFPHAVPDVTGMQVESLLRPLIDFGVKSQQEAYRDTLPPFLRDAITTHHVLVGMNPEMVLSAKGAPGSKIREADEQTPFEEWIYGTPPEDVEFVRINGNRVIRVEDAKFGQTPVIRSKNEMGDYWEKQPNPNLREVKLGDQSAASTEQQDARRNAPTLRNPGEKLPLDDGKDHPAMAPVNFPKDQQPSGQSKPASPDTSPSPASTPPATTTPPQNNVATAGPSNSR